MAMKAAKKAGLMAGENADKSERAKALITALAQLEKDFGKGTIMKLGENTHMEVHAVHTGSIALDMALGIGGVTK